MVWCDRAFCPSTQRGLSWSGTINKNWHKYLIMTGKQVTGMVKWYGLITLCSYVFAIAGCKGKEPDSSIQVKPPVILSDEVARQRADQIRENVSAQVDPELDLSLWASDSLLADPVALDMDDYGRAFVTQTNRRRTSEFDIRNHRDWELASMAFQDVEDRRAFLRKTLTPETCAAIGKPADYNGDGVQDWRDLLVNSEEAYRIEDKNGDGLADFSQLVATGFQEEVTDVAGAILATDEHLFLGVAPDLWRLTDRNGDGIMDDRESISHGFQVHIGFGGHNLSGLIMGPDGRIYWGIGDIGFHGVDQSGKEWSYPNEGVIVRSNPDGSDFEVFAHGLRNTHEFVFDRYGNIISVDNDGDHPGESERLVYIVNGSDAGWRINWQFGKYNDPENNVYKVWMDEGMYKPRFEGQAAHIIPCIRNYINGPAGMVYNPGTALGTGWEDYFFVVEFNGNPARSGIHAFRLSPDGAGFKFAGDKKILSGVLATGLDVGADGALYATDWIDGWELKGYGRIWKLDVRQPSLEEIRQETQSLLATDFQEKDNQFVLGMLNHPDMRIRQKAQFALADREAVTMLQAAVDQKEQQLPRIHGLWGLNQLIRRGKADGTLLTPYLRDPDPEVRSQACKMLGDVRYKQAGEQLLPLLKDPEARVRFFAAEALGRMAYEPAVPALIGMLQENNDADVYLRHAGALALARIGKVEPVVALSGHDERALRIAAVVTLRHLRHPSLAQFLEDEDEWIVTDAARAINDDLSVDEALPQLGQLLNRTRFSNEALIRRAINANLRVGTENAMQELIDFSLNRGKDTEMRLEALQALGTWIRPSVVDRVDGRYRGVVERDPYEVRNRVGTQLPSLLSEPQEEIRIQTVRTLAKLGITSSSEIIRSILEKDKIASVRAEALKALVILDPESAGATIQAVLEKEEEAVRIAALRQLENLNIDPATISAGLQNILVRGSSEEQQAALAALASLPGETVVAQLSLMLDRLLAGKVEGPLQLGLLETAAANGDPGLQKQIAAFRAKYAHLGEIANYLECMEGGNSRAGRSVLVNNSAAQCLKCHAIRGYGGVAGPPLDDIGARSDRMDILQSLIEPSAHLAPGYGVVTVILLDDQTVSGILQSEDDTRLVIRDSQEKDVTVQKSQVKERINALSSMPPMGDILSREEIRNLIAYLSTLKGESM